MQMIFRVPIIFSNEFNFISASDKQSVHYHVWQLTNLWCCSVHLSGALHIAEVELIVQVSDPG